MSEQVRITAACQEDFGYTPQVCEKCRDEASHFVNLGSQLYEYWICGDCVWRAVRALTEYVGRQRSEGEPNG